MSDVNQQETSDVLGDDRGFFEEDFCAPKPGDFVPFPNEWQSDDLIEVLTDMTDYGWDDLSLVGIVPRELLDSDETKKTIAALKEVGVVTLVDGKSGMRMDADSYEAAARQIAWGARYPYDDPEDAAPAKDWAQAAVRGILDDLRDRGGIKHYLDDIDVETRVEIVRGLADVVRAAFIRRAA